jgi:predicted SnoaL-like aldol condensation-catalyzing enzyme
MRKCIFFLLLGMPFLFNACSNSTESSTATPPAVASTSMAEKNLAASRIVDNAFETGDASKIDSAVAADFVDHTDHGEANRDSLKAMIVMMHKQFPDMKTQIIKELADEDYVFTLMRFAGTSNGQMGMPKGPYDMHAVQVVRFKDGKAVEHWEYTQWQEMEKMMSPMMKEPTKMKEEGKKK